MSIPCLEACSRGESIEVGRIGLELVGVSGGESVGEVVGWRG